MFWFHHGGHICKPIDCATIDKQLGICVVVFKPSQQTCLFSGGFMRLVSLSVFVVVQEATNKNSIWTLHFRLQYLQIFCQIVLFKILKGFRIDLQRFCMEDHLDSDKLQEDLLQKRDQTIWVSLLFYLDFWKSVEWGILIQYLGCRSLDLHTAGACAPK